MNEAKNFLLKYKVQFGVTIGVGKTDDEKLGGFIFINLF